MLQTMGIEAKDIYVQVHTTLIMALHMVLDEQLSMSIGQHRVPCSVLVGSVQALKHSPLDAGALGWRAEAQLHDNKGHAAE